MLIAGMATTFIYPQKVDATSWYDMSWLYRKSFNVLGTADGTQTNYQLKVYAYYGAGTDTGFVLREPTSGNYAADAGTNTTTIVDAALTSTVDSYYIGAKVYNSTRSLWSVVTDYVASTKTLTISPAIASQTNGDVYYLYEIPPVMYFNGKCQEDFDDIRFTRSDGLTKLDHWVESYTASTSAIIWVEFNTINQPSLSNPTNTFWVYYGNPAATSVSNGTNTFIAFDDFERGEDGDTVGGAWTESVAHVHISTDHNYTQNGFRSAKLVGANGTQPRAYISLVYSATQRIHYRVWKENAAVITTTHGTAGEAWYLYYRSDETIAYINAVPVEVATGLSITADTWQNIYIYNFNTTSDLASFLINDYSIGSIGDTFGTVEYNDTFNLIAGNGFGTNSTTGDYSYIDDFFVTKWTTNEPRWSTFTAEVSLGPLPTISSAKVFRSYIDTDDWLITYLCLNIYEPYYSDGSDVEQLFYAQLYDVAGTTMLAQTKPSAWGYRPGAIYLSSTAVTPLTWGSAYRVRIYGNFTPNPYTEYVLQASDWMGDNLILLDSWTRSSAILIENYYSVSLTEYIAGKGITLNEDGCVIFSDGVPELDSIRPNLFQIVSSSTAGTPGSYTQINRPVWQTMWGPQITATLTIVGNIFNINGQTAGALIAFMFYALVAACCFPSGSAAAAIGIPFVIMIAVFATGLISMAMLGVILSVAAFILIWQFWFKGG